MIPVWIATISTLNENNVITNLHFSDGAYIDSNSHYYEPRMLQPAIVKVSPSDGGTFHCYSSPSIGEIELINIDGGLNFMADYALDNGLCKLSLIDSNGLKTDYLTGVISSMHDSGDKVILTLRSMSELLALTHPNAKYTGSNALPSGLEGVASDIKGGVKPRVYGSIRNAAPVLVNTARLIYQFSDRNTCTVSAVYDKGASLTLGSTYTLANLSTFETTAVTAGQFNRCCGYVKLGVTPVGTVTGDASDSTTLAGDVFNEIVNELSFSSASITFNSTSKTALNAVGSIGIYKTGEDSTVTLLDKIIASCGAIWFFNDSVIYAKTIALATSYVVQLEEYEIISIERTATGLGSNGVPIAACTIDYDRIETVQSATELAGSVTDARKAVLSQQTRAAMVADTAVTARHSFAGYISIDSALRTESDAVAVATRLLNLAKKRVDVVRITAILNTIPVLTVGDGVKIFHRKLNYTAGKIVTITSIEIDAKRKKITIEGIA